MDQEHIKEAGCAVCGLLKPFNELSNLKFVKNLLHILQQEDITEKLLIGRVQHTCCYVNVHLVCGKLKPM